MEYMPNILGTLRKELHRRKGYWPFIAKRAGVSYSFIAHVAGEVTDDPKLTGVQRVLDVLYKIETGKIKLPT